ncbi:complement C3-like [Narcine bancroftii]|uniref:complement C3-like n=1 Tax=Narcine bancroftii TaxID=1343680 RepID=UPI0038312B5C
MSNVTLDTDEETRRVGDSRCPTLAVTMAAPSVLGVLAGLLLASLWVSVSEQKSSYLITAPKVIRVGVKESVTVQVFKAQSEVQASIYFLDQLSMVLCSERYTLQLNNTNHFTQTLQVQILPEMVDECKLARQTSHIMLAAEIPELFPRRRLVHLHLRPKPFFIFIETDKLTYRPGETVWIRSFTLDHLTRITDCGARLKILQENRVVTESENRRQVSDKVCGGQISIHPSILGDFEIQAISTAHTEYLGHRRFRIEAPGDQASGRNETKIQAYVINLSKMRRFFIPGAPFRIQATVTYPDGSPVAEVPINIMVIVMEKKSIEESQFGITDDTGEMSLSFIVPPEATHMYITVTAGSEADGVMVNRSIAIKPHLSEQVYLHIDTPRALLYPGNRIEVQLTALGLGNHSHVEHYYYMLLTKGKLLHYERVPRTASTKIMVNVTQSMVPYFRIVAYYLAEINGEPRLVSDAVRLEVENLCDLKFQILPNLVPDNSSKDYLLSVFTEDTASVHVRVENQQLAKAGLDMGIYQQVFYRMDMYDFGTSYGGGRDATGVFEDAGLRLISDLLVSSALSEETTVPWQRSPLLPFRDDLEVTKTIHTIEPLHRSAWMWVIQKTTGTNTYRLTSNIALPNLWEISAFSVSEERELCIAKPLIVKIDEGV